MEGNRIAFSGPSGLIRWGYHTAATVGPWTLSNGTLTAPIVTCDDFKASQRPLTFVVPQPKSDWVWSVQSLQIAGGSLTAVLGPSE